MGSRNQERQRGERSSAAAEETRRQWREGGGTGASLSRRFLPPSRETGRSRFAGWRLEGEAAGECLGVVWATGHLYPSSVQAEAWNRTAQQHVAAQLLAADPAPFSQKATFHFNDSRN